MSQRLMSITVKGKRHNWIFEFDGDTKYWQDWIDDGLDVYLVENIMPYWANPKIWCFLQDIWHMKFLRRK